MLGQYVVISIQEAIAYWKGINPNVELTEERLDHIRQHHPEDFDKCVNYLIPAIQEPDLILDDHKNPLTAMFIKCFDEAGINVVIKLALSSDENSRSFVVTIHPVGARSIQKLSKKNIVVYNRLPNLL